MSKIMDLRQKRADLWEQTKKFLDEAKRDGDVLCTDDVAKYEKMEADIVALGKEIDILERQAEMEKKLNAPTSKPVVNTPDGGGKEKTGRASDEYKNAFWKAMNIYATRTLTTESTAVLIPYKTQEIIDDGGLYYGINSISHNLLMCNNAWM